MARLQREVAAGTRVAVETFWADIGQRGTPLVEPSPGGDRHSLVTFLWKGSAKTRNVVIVDGVAAGVGGVNPANSQMQRLARTDVWFRTYEVRNDAGFAYKLSENDPMDSFYLAHAQGGDRPRPAQPPRVRRVCTLELPDAPPLLPGGRSRGARRDRRGRAVRQRGFRATNTPRGCICLQDSGATGPPIR